MRWATFQGLVVPSTGTGQSPASGTLPFGTEISVEPPCHQLVQPLLELRIVEVADHERRLRLLPRGRRVRDRADATLITSARSPLVRWPANAAQARSAGVATTIPMLFGQCGCHLRSHRAQRSLARIQPRRSSARIARAVAFVPLPFDSDARLGCADSPPSPGALASRMAHVVQVRAISRLVRSDSRATV